MAAREAASSLLHGSAPVVTSRCNCTDEHEEDGDGQEEEEEEEEDSSRCLFSVP